jgi:hypothetical protein
MDNLGLFVYGIIVIAGLIFTVVLVTAPLKLYAIHRELQTQTELLSRIVAGTAGNEAPTPERVAKPADPPPTPEELDRRFRAWQQKR